MVEIQYGLNAILTHFIWVKTPDIKFNPKNPQLNHKLYTILCLYRATNLNFIQPRYNGNNSSNLDSWTPSVARKSVDFCRYKLTTKFGSSEASSNEGSCNGETERKSRSLRALVRVQSLNVRNN